MGKDQRSPRKTYIPRRDPVTFWRFLAISSLHPSQLDPCQTYRTNLFHFPRMKRLLIPRYDEFNCVFAAFVPVFVLPHTQQKVRRALIRGDAMVVIVRAHSNEFRMRNHERERKRKRERKKNSNSRPNLGKLRRKKFLLCSLLFLLFLSFFYLVVLNQFLSTFIILMQKLKERSNVWSLTDGEKDQWCR